MVFRATLQEVAIELGLSDAGLAKAGSRGVTTHLESLESGMMYVDVAGDPESGEAAFQKGASFLLLSDDSQLSEEAKSHALVLDDPTDSLWSLFRWWRARQEQPFFVVVGEPPFTVWFQEIAAHFFLSKLKGFYGGAHSASLDAYPETQLACDVMNSEEETNWYLLSLSDQMKRLSDELQPTKVFRSSDIPQVESAAEESMTYMTNGRVGYLSPEVSLSEWPIPMKTSARVVVIVLQLAESLGIHFEDDEIIELGKKFYPPPFLGFHSSLGEFGSIWVERVCKPEREEVELLLTYRDQLTVAFLVEDKEGIEALSGLSSPAPVFYWPEEGSETLKNNEVIQVATFEEVLESLLTSPPFFLIAFTSEQERGDKLFHMREELYNLAQAPQNNGEGD